MPLNFSNVTWHYESKRYVCTFRNICHEFHNLAKQNIIHFFEVGVFSNHSYMVLSCNATTRARQKISSTKLSQRMGVMNNTLSKDMQHASAQDSPKKLVRDN